MKKIENICIIDDDIIFQLLTKKVITDSQLVNQVNVFSNGLEAITFLKSAHDNNTKLPDLILLDIFMPIMDGWKFLEQYKLLQSKLCKTIPIYIVSSSIDSSDIRKSKAINTVTDYIVKPLTKDAFTYIMKNYSSNQF
ncbi:response regulator [Flavobacterium sp. SM15]|uniref:response regulator n=1 Tax=Flavobacterium sp. SM15 TaxID=2908005 RepID=UPI001EDBEA63|nr:response regulator [Flavobacterium sp. SM15]MCG2612309.1 response regulator [Flavobacterium sp. SM15]